MMGVRYVGVLCTLYLFEFVYKQWCVARENIFLLAETMLVCLYLSCAMYIQTYELSQSLSNLKSLLNSLGQNRTARFDTHLP